MVRRGYDALEQAGNGPGVLCRKWGAARGWRVQGWQALLRRRAGGTMADERGEAPGERGRDVHKKPRPEPGS